MACSISCRGAPTTGRNCSSTTPPAAHEGAGGAALYATIGATLEDRSGGELFTPGAGYTETMHTTRVDAGLDWHQPIDDSTHLVFKASVAENRRDQLFGALSDRRRRFTAYGAVRGSAQRGSSEWVLGDAWQHDDLRATDESDAIGLAATMRSVELFDSRRGRTWTTTLLYGYLDATIVDPADGLQKPSTLVPRHAVGLGLAWTGSTRARVSLDAFYTGSQALEANPNRTESPPYTFICLLWSQPIRPGVELWLNAENLADARQTRVDRLLLPVPDPLGRRTTPVWGQLEGRVVNLGPRVTW